MSSPDSSSTTLSRSSRSSSGSSSSLHIDVPTATASMAQNPTSTAWRHPHHHSHIPVPHMATPHPLAAATQYLDKHVAGAFSRHHAEFNVNRQARAAKREARHSLVDSPIPEYGCEDEDRRGSDRQQRPRRASTALRTAAVASFAPASVDGESIVDIKNEGDDNEACTAILAKREAARLRSGSGLSGSSGGDDLGAHHHHTDEQSASTGGIGIESSNQRREVG